MQNLINQIKTKRKFVTDAEALELCRVLLDRNFYHDDVEDLTVNILHTVEAAIEENSNRNEDTPAQYEGDL